MLFGTNLLAYFIQKMMQPNADIVKKRRKNEEEKVGVKQHVTSMGFI